MTTFEDFAEAQEVLGERQLVGGFEADPGVVDGDGDAVGLALRKMPWTRTWAFCR